MKYGYFKKKYREAFSPIYSRALLCKAEGSRKNIRVKKFWRRKWFLKKHLWIGDEIQKECTEGKLGGIQELWN